MLIDTKTSVYAVIGDPVLHSLSPLIHNTAFSHKNYNGVYVAFRVTNIKAAISAVKELGICGLSVTIPHKIDIMPYLNHIDEEALKIGAVNTVINHDGLLWGYNSDSLGAIQAISEVTSIRGKEVSIIGAGGSARALGFGIIEAGGILTIINRTQDKGKELAKDLDASFCHISEFNNINCQILINATPVGMYPNIDHSPIDKKYINKDMIIMDIVYNPLKTKLLKDAKDIGCQTIDGVPMFVYQAAFQFELWTGLKAPLDVMMKVIRGYLNK